MKKGRFGIVLLVIVIILIALIQAGQKTPIDWSKSFNPHDKNPFGTFVIQSELKNIFPQNKSFRKINQSIYSYFEDSTSSIKGTKDLLFIGQSFSPGKTSVKALLSFVAKGNNVFLSVNNPSSFLEDTLRLETRYFNNYVAGIPFTNDTVFYTLPAYQLETAATKLPSQTFFSQLNDSLTTILGYLKIDTLSVPNFVSVKFGEGHFFLHLYPEAFSNYYLLDSTTYPLAYEGLHHLKGTHFLWYDGLFGSDKYQAAQTPLRYILSNSALRSAWYLLLITLLLFILFKSKREQKVIPVIEPEKNLSVSFAETIGALYYESGDVGNMTQKKIQYFLHSLKKEYKFGNVALKNADFIKKATLRLKLPEKDIKIFFDKLYFYQNQSHPTTQDLKDLNELIENFKQKISIK